MRMETHFTRRIGLLCPGRQARLILLQEEPKPPTFVKTINIMIKVLDQAKVSGPVKAYERNDKKFGPTKSVVGRNSNVVIREFNGNATHLDPPRRCSA